MSVKPTVWGWSVRHAANACDRHQLADQGPFDARFELIHKLDQLMPLIQTLEIEEVISEKQAEQQRSNCNRIVLSMSSTARNFAVGVRRRMNEVDARRAQAADRQEGRPRPESPPASHDAVESAHDGAGDAEREGEVHDGAGAAERGGEPQDEPVGTAPEAVVDLDAVGVS